jgi:uncharacterized protein YbaR (Trm112 family)
VSAAAAAQPWREDWVRSLLRCPVDRAELADATGADGGEVLACTDPAHPVAYPVSGGVPVLLADDAVPFAGPAQGSRQ